MSVVESGLHGRPAGGELNSSEHPSSSEERIRQEGFNDVQSLFTRKLRAL